ncbi:TRAP-type mannitol/chloroaromatic compound transport system, small permease component [Desulfuromusa kysingii]|uniref:TRAP-type mannitol/chloroaromatic compound transport system, small permease component n=1 Tax=Desulfuromusa kysingii TaxID=37625 RepID=A0A1H4CJC2_9BACT|nr:TRAP transporter small permease subunit [Desulfuromusa kysingii]SEA60410.1 TRAP-type mannitol/chloroaromatic compound transport system, small permease component [Desulfuromusa kysingii]
MKLIQRIVLTIDKLSTKIGHLTSWLSTILVLTVCYDVFTRYFLRKSSVGVQELEWHIFAVLFMLSAAYTLKIDKHVRVDVIYTQLSPRAKAWVNMLGGIIFLIPFSILVIWASQGFISMSWAIQETSPDPGGLPCRYLLKAMIPVGFGLLLLQGIAQILRSFCTVIGHPMEDSNTEEIEERYHA